MNQPEASQPVSKDSLLAFQARWMRPAGIAAMAGSFIVVASILAQRVGLQLPDSSSDADQLVFFHAHSSRLILSGVLQAIGLALFMPALWVLFRAAAGRSSNVRPGLVGLVLFGLPALGIALLVSSFGSRSAADDFVKQEPAVVQEARAHPNPAPSGKSDATTTGKSQTTTAKSTTTESTPTGTAKSGTTTTTAQSQAHTKTPDQAAHDAREDLADDVSKHGTLVTIGGILSTAAVLSVVFSLVYTCLWAMRTGLLSRFWSFLGIAFGAFLIFPIFPAIPGLVLWFAAIGLMLSRLWPRPLSPAWDAGAAVPWPRPGDDLAGPGGPGPGPGGTVEGSGREVSESSLPDQQAQGSNGAAELPAGSDESQGQRRKKRKRRD